jgi:hypothetical protein
VATPLCPGCFSSSVFPVPHGAEPRSSDWPETVDGFGALWDAFDDWQCSVCGERWPHVESVIARDARRQSTIERPGPRSILKHRRPVAGSPGSPPKKPNR